MYRRHNDDSVGPIGMTWQDTFDAFTARKRKAAETARLPGYTTVVANDTDRVDLEPIASAWTAALFDGPFFESPAADPAQPAINAVFVQSADGNTGARNPASLGGGATDTHLIYEGLSRVRADAVLTGATTIQDSQMIFSVWHPELVRLRQAFGLPRHPAQIVATRNGRLGIASELLFNVPEVPVFILTSAAGAAILNPQVEPRPWITVLVSEPAAHLADVMKTLRADHGIRRISCIGGRTLATELIDAGLVRDLYLTTAPVPGGEPGTPFYTGAALPHPTCIVKKAGRAEEAGVVFEHLRI
jgi:riboflavin biosynthesis pyrimidine reductase